MTIIIMTELKFLLIFFGCLYRVTQDDDNDDHNEYNEDCDEVLFLIIRMINLEVFLWTDDYDHKVFQEIFNYRLTGATKCFFEERTEGQSELTPTENLGFKGFQKCC